MAPTTSCQAVVSRWSPPVISTLFGNAGPDLLRVLILHSPSLDRYFAELDTLDSSGGLNPGTERDLMRRHGLEPA